LSRKQAESQRPTCDLPQPVLTAAMAMTGTSAAIIVRRGPSSTKSAPLAKAREATCITVWWVTSL